MTAKPILCVGALTYDVILHLPELPSGPGKFIAEDLSISASGMAAIAATAVARLGHPVAFWANAGVDMPGDFLVAEMVREGIATDFIRRVPGVPSGTATILVDARGERMVVPYYHPNLMSPPREQPPIAAGAFAAVMTDVRWPAAAALALDAARVNGIPAILDLDVGPPAVLADLAPRATHLVASMPGARVLTGAEDAAGAVQALASRIPADVVVVTAGEHGAWWTSRLQPGLHHHRAFAVDAVDTNAAGDVYHGAFAVALAEGRDIDAILTFASAAGALKCLKLGGRLAVPTRADVDRFLKEWAS
jgi:sulfofructose kinase